VKRVVVVEWVGVIFESSGTETIDGGMALCGDSDRVKWSGRDIVVGSELKN
jgi:hypothetical protein